MKICIPSQDGRGLDSEIHPHFGSAPWFTFVDTTTGKIESVENPSCHTGGGNCHHVGVLARRGVDAVMSSGIGRRAWAGLNDAGITVYQATGGTVYEVVALVKSGEARRLDLAATCEGGHHGGHGGDGPAGRHRRRQGQGHHD